MKNINLSILLTLFIFGCSSASKDIDDHDPKYKKAQIYYQHGTTKLVQKDYEAALDFLRKALKVREVHDKTHNNIGMAYYFKNKNDYAIKHLKRALEINSKNSDARNNLAGVYIKTGRLQLALREYNTVLSDLVYKNQFRTHYNIALINLRQGNERKAYSHFKKSVEIRKDYCSAHFQLGLIYKRKHEYNRAIDSFKKSLEGDCQNTPSPHYQMALSYKNMGKADEAFKKFGFIAEQFPTSRFSVLAENQQKNINWNKKSVKNTNPKIKAKNSVDGISF